MMFESLRDEIYEWYQAGILWVLGIVGLILIVFATIIWWIW
jgi:hypothetical protein